MAGYVGVLVSDPWLQSQFTQVELRTLKSQYASMKKEKGELTAGDLGSEMTKLKAFELFSEEEVGVIVGEYHSNAEALIDFEGFLRMYLNFQTRANTKLGGSKNKSAFLKNATTTLLHTIGESEKVAYVAHINSYLRDDPVMKRYLPIDPMTNDLFDIVKDGILLCKLINVAVPGTIDDRAINTKLKLNPWEINENHTLCLNSSKAIGCTVVNIGTQDLVEGRPHLVLGLISQIIKIQLLADLSLKKTPALVELVDDSKDVEELMNLPPDKVLLRWMNFHLQKAGYKRNVTNFSSDVKVNEYSNFKALYFLGNLIYSIILYFRLQSNLTYCSPQACLESESTSCIFYQQFSFKISLILKGMSAFPYFSEISFRNSKPGTLFHGPVKCFLGCWLFFRSERSWPYHIQDGEAYSVLLNVLAPEYCCLATMDTENPMERAKLVLAQAEKMDCTSYLSPKDIVEGSPNLNLAFVAHLFHKRSGLSLDPNKVSFAEMMEDNVQVSREERAFRLWINSLGIDTFINHLFEDVRNGWVLLEVLDKVAPGMVNWKQASKPPIKMPFRKVENCNQVIRVGKQLNFSLVNVAGNDIVQGNKKLLLAYLWQLMRYNMLQLLRNLRLRSSHKEISDLDILNWANAKVKNTGRSSQMESFRDKSLTNGIFLLELLSSVEPRVVNWYIVTKGENEEEKRLNATYIISVARKLGCSVFLLPEDIVEVNPKMILILIASIMLWSLTKQTSEDVGISDSENGSVNGSFSNLVIDDSTSEASLPLDNGSESASEQSFEESRGGD